MKHYSISLCEEGFVEKGMEVCCQEDLKEEKAWTGGDVICGDGQERLDVSRAIFHLVRLRVYHLVSAS